MFYILESVEPKGGERNPDIVLHIFTTKKAREHYTRIHGVNLRKPVYHDVNGREMTKIVEQYERTQRYERPQKLTPIPVSRINWWFH